MKVLVLEVGDHMELQSSFADKPALVVESQGSTSPISPKRKTDLDERIADLASKLPWLRPEPGSDTLVFIDPPVSQGYSYLSHDASACEHFAHPFSIRSMDLEKLQSPYFTRLLQYDYQQLVRSRRGLDSLPKGIKYVLDLTPKLEGEEAVRYLEDLSCPPGILHWFESIDRWQVSAMLVSGRDEFTERSIGNKKRRLSEVSAGNKENLPVKTKQEVEGGEVSVSVSQATKKAPDTKQEDPPLEPEPEYTQLRHRLAIERFLMAVSGQDPKLDSAVKVYTTVMVSKGFDVRGYNPLADYVVRWLYADPNSRFIEALPEVTLAMADILQNESLARDAFAILAGEMVLDSAAMHISPSKTCLGRCRTEIGETWQSRLEYARNSLTERIQTTFENLAGDRMDWIDELDMMESLKTEMRGSAPACGEAYQDLSRLLKNYVRGALYHAMASTYVALERPSNSNSTGGDSLFPKRSMIDHWNELRPQHRIYTRAFWSLLQSFYFEDLYDASDEISSDMETNISLMNLKYHPVGVSENAHDLIGTRLYTHVDRKDLTRAIEHCKGFLPIPDSSHEGGIPIGKAANSNPYCNYSGCDYNKLLFTGQCICCSVTYCPKHRPMIIHGCQTSHGKNGTSGQSSPASKKPVDRNPSLTHRPMKADGASSASGRNSPAWSSGVELHTATQTAPLNNAAADASSPSAANIPENWYDDIPENYDGSSHESGNTLKLASQDTPVSWMNYLGGQTGYRLGRHRLLSQIRDHVQHIANSVLVPPQGGQLASTIDVYLTTTMLCLGEEEARYLPLWAGGLDDGTSGVYTSNVPFATDGFKGPPASTNEFSIRGLGEEYDAMDDDKTIATSAFVNDGYSDTMHRQKVYAMSEIESVDWDFVRTVPKAQAASAPKDDDLDIVSNTSVATPTKPKASNDLGAMNDAYMDIPDEVEGSEIWDSDGEDSEGERVSDEIASKESDDSPGSYVLDTESVSYGGFSEADSSSFGVVATPTLTTSSPEPENIKPGASTSSKDPASTIPGDKASGKRAVANDIGSELKSPYANVWYTYKDGPEDDPLLNRP